MDILVLGYPLGDVPNAGNVCPGGGKRSGMCQDRCSPVCWILKIPSFHHVRLEALPHVFHRVQGGVVGGQVFHLQAVCDLREERLQCLGVVGPVVIRDEVNLAAPWYRQEELRTRSWKTSGWICCGARP